MMIGSSPLGVMDALQRDWRAILRLPGAATVVLALAALLLAALALSPTQGAPAAARAVPPPLEIRTSHLALGKFGRGYAVRLLATHGTPPYRWRVVRGRPPAGLGLTAGGLLVGQPRHVGGWRFTVRVTDRAGQRDASTLRLRVKVNVDARVSKVERSALRYSYRRGCPVGPDRLRRVTVNQWGFDRAPYRGELVVRRGAVPEVKRVLRAALRARFPVRKMHQVDRYRGSDPRSMRADNTSAFNCRHVTGNPTRLSQHAYGNAVDINPRENPYVTSAHVYPPGSRRYLDRSPRRRGMIMRRGVVARTFARAGWHWGGRWSEPDYQHFSENGQ